MPVNILNLPGSMNAKIRGVYRDGRGYTFERLRAKMLFSDRMQKPAIVQEKVKVRKRPRFDEINLERMAFFDSMHYFDDFQLKIQERKVNLGTDLSTLEAEIDAGKF